MVDFSDDLRLLQAEGLLRDPTSEVPTARINACSNDYLGYGREPVSRATLLACEGAGTGAGASRLIHGTAEQHLQLEQEVASWVGLPTALLFSSGYAANVGALQGLCGSHDLVVSDALNHASIIDGCRLSRAKVAVVPHLDPDALRRALELPGARKWVVTESYFSMDGDSPNLPELRAACDRAGAGLIVDEAHALGVLGDGRGLCAQLDVVPDALIGTLGKAVGAQGAFVASSETTRTWLWNRARSLVFSTAPSPVVATLALTNVRRARDDHDARARLLELTRQAWSELIASGVVQPAATQGPIIPILIGDNERAVQVSNELGRAGVLVQAIRPPTVPTGSARLRVTISAAMTPDEVRELTRLLTVALRGHM
jgi:8-amino-7-oxononanoate synthase